MDDETKADPSAPRRRGWVLTIVLVACALPLVAGAVGLAVKGWVPVGEAAQAELRVRDFWAHPPMLGAVGRLRTANDVSSHPGPAAWWAMYPVYALLGRSAAALSAAVAATAIAWMAAAITLAWRKGGDALAVILGLGVLLMVAALGPTAFLEPWNPWFAIMPFLCMIIAVWRTCDSSPWSLVVVVAAGSYCVQAHFGYAPLVAALGLTALIGLWWSGPRRDGSWRPLTVPLAVTAGVTAVMWIPPLIQQLTGDPGNLGVMLQAYREEADTQSTLGLGAALRLVGSYLDVRAPSLVLEDVVPTDRSATLGTLATLAAFALASWMAWRRRNETQLRAAGALLVVTAVGMLAAVAAASRIPGEVFGYLILWLGVLVTAMGVAIVWTAWLGTGQPPRSEEDESTGAEDRRSLKVRHGVGIAAVMALGVMSLAVTVDFADPPVPSGNLSTVAAELIDPVADSLTDSGPYLVRWDDPVAFGGLGTALLSELERRGIDVGVDDHLRVEMGAHRVLSEDAALAAIWVVSGAAIDDWRNLSEVQELAYADPRTPEQRDRSEQLHDEVIDELVDIGADDLADTFDRNSWAVRSDPRVDEHLVSQIDELTRLGLPTAVFLAPADTAQPPPA